MKFVHRAQQGSLEIAPSGGIGAELDPIYFVILQPHPFADHDVLSPLVLSPAEPADAQDQQFAFPRRECGPVQDVIAEYQPSFEQFRMSSEGAEDVEDATVHLQAFKYFACFVVPAVFCQWFKPRLTQAHEIFTTSIRFK